jgi:hypothetical protein
MLRKTIVDIVNSAVPDHFGRSRGLDRQRH